MGRPKRCAKRPNPYISYTPTVEITTTTTINPLDDPNNYIVIPQSGIDCIREIDPCPCGELFIPKSSGTNYIVVNNDYGSWGTYDSKTLIAILNYSSIYTYLHAEDVYLESGETFKTITSKNNSVGSFYLDNFVLQVIDGLNEVGNGYEEHPFVFNNRIKVALKSKEDNEVFAEKYFGSIGSTNSLNKLVLNNQDFFKRINIVGKTLILEIHSVCDFEVEKCIPDASVDPTTTTTTTTTSTTPCYKTVYCNLCIDGILVPGGMLTNVPCETDNCDACHAAGMYCPGEIVICPTTTTTTTTEEPTTTTTAEPTTTTTTEEPTTTTTAEPTTTTTEEPTTTEQPTTTTTEEPTTTEQPATTTTEEPSNTTTTATTATTSEPTSTTLNPTTPSPPVS